ncbi:MAG: prenyltransferase/squalene oxidase repeat-containing protein [Candidatus Andersenbacteria bacterium]
MRENIHRVVAAGLFFILTTGAIAVTFVPVRAATTVHLRIEGSAATLFAGHVAAGDCTVVDTTGVAHELSSVGACALVAAAEATGLTYEFQDFGFGLFLKRIGNDDTPADFSKSWGFFVNYDPAAVGIDSYTPQSGDDLLLAFAAFPGVPLRVTLPSPINADQPAEILVEQRVGDYDENFNWHGQWENAGGATLHVNDKSHEVGADGVVIITPTPGELTIEASGPTFIRSARQVVTVLVPSPSPISSPTPTPSPSLSPSPSPVASSSPSPSLFPSPLPSPSPTPAIPTLSPSPTPPPGHVAGITTTDRQERAAQALRYLRARQQGDGSIDGQITSAWSAIAFGANNERASAVTVGSNSLAHALARTSLESALDVERLVLAVRAGGGDPRRFGGQNLVTKLKGYYHHNQIGEETLVNDDIFGVLALLAAGEPVSGNPIAATVQTILTKQTANGSWVGIDITAAATQALQAYQRQGGEHNVQEALERARHYLQLNQDQYGGFGENSASTAWALQAIIALGENPNDWQNTTGATPWHALLRYQSATGGFGWRSHTDVSAFMTAYAAVALLGTPWPVTTLPVITDIVGGQITTDDSSLLATQISVPPVARAAGTTTSVPVMSPSPYYQSLAGPDERLATQAALSSPIISPLSSPRVTPPLSSSLTPPVPVTATDHRFAFALFGLANIGVGVTLTRLLAKLNVL